VNLFFNINDMADSENRTEGTLLKKLKSDSPGEEVLKMFGSSKRTEITKGHRTSSTALHYYKKICLWLFFVPSHSEFHISSQRTNMTSISKASHNWWMKLDYVLKLWAYKLTLLFLVRGEAFITISPPFPVPFPVPLHSSVAMESFPFLPTFGIEGARKREKETQRERESL
jgi:hypothetical protein